MIRLEGLGEMYYYVNPIHILYFYQNQQWSYKSASYVNGSMIIFTDKRELFVAELPEDIAERLTSLRLL